MDGEGTLGCYRHKSQHYEPYFVMRCTIAMGHKETMDWIGMTLGRGVTMSNRVGKVGSKDTVPIYFMDCGTPRITRAILKRIRRWMKTKAQEADLALQACDILVDSGNRDARLQAISDGMKAIKRESQTLKYWTREDAIKRRASEKQGRES